MLARAVATLLAFLALTGPAWALTTYYVDPNWGGTQSGTAAQPWTDVGANWSTVQTSLNSGPVTIYFSARLSTSDANVTSTTPIAVLGRTDASTNLLTLDGISFYNTSEVSPSWSASQTPTTSDPKWSSSHFQVTGTNPISTETTPFPATCNHHITIQGFRLIRTEGQLANLGYTGNLTFQYNVLSANSGGSYGPGTFAGPANSGIGCGSGGSNDNVSILYNWVQSSWGECIYIGGGTADPPGPGVNQSTGDGYVIQGNKLQGCAAVGGQGDGIDVKDGHTNLKILGNWISTRSNGGAPDFDSNGIEVESASLIDGNYIERPGHQAIVLWSSYGNGTGRTVRVSNNIVVNVTGGSGNEWGIDQDVKAAALSVWTATFYNNTVHVTAAAFPCYHIGSGHNPAIVENNIASQCGTISVLDDGSGTTLDYNLAFNSGVPVGAHSVNGDPKFANATSPYADVNFKLQAGSPAIGAGVDLSGTFTTDYGGNTRSAPFTIGAWQTGAAPSGVNPQIPGGLRIGRRRL